MVFLFSSSYTLTKIMINFIYYEWLRCMYDGVVLIISLKRPQSLQVIRDRVICVSLKVAWGCLEDKTKRVMNLRRHTWQE